MDAEGNGDSEGNGLVVCEISPLRSYFGEVSMLSVCWGKTVADRSRSSLSRI